MKCDSNGCPAGSGTDTGRLECCGSAMLLSNQLGIDRAYLVHVFSKLSIADAIVKIREQIAELDDSNASLKSRSMGTGMRIGMGGGETAMARSAVRRSQTLEVGCDDLHELFSLLLPK